MPDINPSVPIVGQPDSTEEPKVVTALTQLISAVNDVDSDQILDGTIAVADLATALAEALVPAGTILPTAAPDADDGYLLCDGAAVSRGTYAALFNRIGTAYGTGDGSTTFNLPDMQGRVPAGKGTHATVDALGESEGSALANRTPKHWHDGDVLSGDLIVGTGSGASSFASAPATFAANTTRAGQVDINGDVGVTTGPQDAPAYLVVNYQIKT